jgi:1-phosphofructokinase
MSLRNDPPRVAVFSPDLLLTVTIESQSSPGAGGSSELHVHAGGQGVWVARMVRELGAIPVLCALIGGETGDALAPLLPALRGDLRLVPSTGSSGGYVVDHRGGERQLVASSLRPAPHRHEIDDLVTSTVAAALSSSVLVVCNPFPAEGFPEDVYETITADVKSGGVPVLIDLSSPRLERTLGCGPDLVKLNDWELAEYVRGPVDGPRALAAAERLRAAGAQNVVVTRGGGPILVLAGPEAAYEIQPPDLRRGYREGCGDTMMGATAAAWAAGKSPLDAIVLGAAAGAVNYMRRGLGTGRRAAVEEMTRQISARPLLKTAA